MLKIMFINSVFTLISTLDFENRSWNSYSENIVGPLISLCQSQSKGAGDILKFAMFRFNFRKLIFAITLECNLL